MDDYSTLRNSAGESIGGTLAQPSGLTGVPGEITPTVPRGKAKPQRSIDFALAGAPFLSIFAHLRPLWLEPAPAKALTRHARLGYSFGLRTRPI